MKNPTLKNLYIQTSKLMFEKNYSLFCMSDAAFDIGCTGTSLDFAWELFRLYFPFADQPETDIAKAQEWALLYLANIVESDHPY